MITRQRLVTYGIPTIAAATIITAALLRPRPAVEQAPPYEPTAPTQGVAKKIDVVFVIDTTESMQSLIDGARATVWGIASHIRDANPQADIQMGLVAYRDTDPGDEYVTRDFQITSDLDRVFGELSSYRADGGDDIPEDVAAGLNDAVTKMHWRDGARKIVFLVGDAPPIQRNDGVPPYREVAREGASRGIIINTIRCGTIPGTAEAWQEIAQIGHGDYSSIDADGGVRQVATGFDAKMAELSGRIDSTTVILGADRRAAYEGKMAAAKAAPVAVQADRGAYYSGMGSAAARDDGDAVSAVASGKTTVEAMPADELPPELQHLTKDELQAEMNRRVEERKALNKELQDLKAKRAEVLKGKGGGGFDAKVKETIDRQLQ